MITLNNIELSLKQKSWWAIIVNLLPAKYLTYFIANFTKLTPNQVTLISLIFAICSGIAFYFHYFILGAIIYQISYIYDIVDGALARVKNLTSKIGAFFDVITDWIKAPILIAILLIVTNHYILLLMIIFLLFWNCCVNKYNDMLFYTTKKSITKSDELANSKIGKYFEFMKNKHIQPLPGSVEFEALVLFLYPVCKQQIFLYLAILLQIFNLLLKIYVIIKKLK